MSDLIPKVSLGNSSLQPRETTSLSAQEPISVFPYNGEIQNCDELILETFRTGNADIDDFNDNAERIKLKEDIEELKNSIYTQVEKMSLIANSNSNYDGEIPEYTDTASKIVKNSCLIAIIYMIDGKTDNERKSIYKFMESTVKDRMKETTENQSLNPKLKEFKNKYYNDQLKVIKDLQNKLGCNKESLLQTISKQTLGIALNNTNALGVYSDLAPKMVDLLFPTPSDNKKVIPLIDLSDNTELSQIQSTDNPKDSFENVQTILNNYMEYYKENKAQGKANWIIEEEYEKYLNKNSTNITNARYKNELINEMKKLNLKTHDLQAVYLSIEGQIRKSLIKQIEKEIDNRKNQNTTNDIFSEWNDEKLEKAKKNFEDEYKIIHDYYREIVPSELENNAEKLFELLAVILTAKDNSGINQNNKNYTYDQGTTTIFKWTWK